MLPILEIFALMVFAGLFFSIVVCATVIKVVLILRDMPDSNKADTTEQPK